MREREATEITDRRGSDPNTPGDPASVIRALAADARVRGEAVAADPSLLLVSCLVPVPNNPASHERWVGAVVLLTPGN